METVILKARSLRMTDEDFFNFCVENRDLNIERTSLGEIIIISPTGLESEDRNSELNTQVLRWNKRTELGKVSDSSAAFTLSARLSAPRM